MLSTTTAAAPAPAAMPGATQVVSSLFFVIAIVFVLAFILKRVQGLRGGASGGVVVHGGLQVGARERVVLIESCGRRVLLGVAPGSVRTLHVFDPSEIAALPATSISEISTPASAFAQKLKAMLGKQS